MPVYLRNFYFKELSEAKKEEQKQIDKVNKKSNSSINRPNITPR